MQGPRIGFNLFPYQDSRSGGIFYYALAMLREFARKAPERLTLFCGRHSSGHIRGIDGLENVMTSEIEEPGQIFDHRHEFDVLFTPATWGGIAMLDYPTIHVLADIQEQYYPQFFSAGDLRHRNIIHPWVSNSSTILITISNFSKRTIIEKFGVPEEKVRVTHLAAHPIFSDESELGVRPANMPEEKGFLFYPSNSWNHKNHRGLLDALVELRERYDLRVPAILSGHLLEGDFNRFDLPNEIRARRLEGQVFHIGRTDLHSLKYLYSNAAALIHPSLFEGFGIPLVEAMSSGCPVIAARSTSIPEVCGESALYFDPHDHVDIADKINQFFENPAQAEARRKLGKAKASQYSYGKTADETLNIIRDAYRLAGERALEERIKSASAKPRGPVISAVVYADAKHLKSNCSDMTKLCSEGPDLVEVICVRPKDEKKRSNACGPSDCAFVDGSDGIRSVLERVVRMCNGRYVFFSDGTSVPLRSFVLHLAEENEDRAAVQLLHGDSYVKDPTSGHIRELTTMTDDIDAIKSSCCSNLSFVVRADAFRRFLNESSEGWSSVQRMASELWDYCEKRRVYKIVNCVSAPLGSLDRLAHRLRSRSVLAKLVSTRIGGSVASQILRIHRAIRPMIRGFVRASRRGPRR